MMTFVISSGFFNPTASLSSMMGEEERYYWHIRSLISSHNNHEVLSVSPNAIHPYTSNSWTSLTAAVERLVYDEGLVLSYATAGDDESLLLKIHAEDNCRPDIPPTSPWYSLKSPCQRTSHPHPGKAVKESLTLSTAQIHYLGFIHSKILARLAGDKRVLTLYPYAQAIESPAPVKDFQRALEHMLYEEKSIAAFASREGNQFLVKIANEDIIATQEDACRTSDWISVDNPHERTAQGPLLSIAAKIRRVELTKRLDSYYQAFTSTGSHELDPHSELNTLGKEITTLLSQIPCLPESLSNDCRFALILALAHADGRWYQETLPNLQPALVKGLVQTAWALKAEWISPAKFLLCIEDQLERLPPDHCNALAFFKGFPSSESRKSLAGLSYASRSDQFFEDFLIHVRASNTAQRGNVLKLVCETVFSGDNEERKSILIRQLSYNDPIFLARNFYQLSPPLQSTIWTETLFRLAEALIQQPAEDAPRNLKAIAERLAQDSDYFASSLNYRTAVIALFSLGGEALQAKILRESIEEYRLREFLPTLPPVSVAVWTRVGEAWRANYKSHLRNLIIDDVPPEALVGLINGTAARPCSSCDEDTDFIARLYRQLFKSRSITLELVSHLSNNALQFLCKTFSADVETGWQPFIKSLQHCPQCEVDEKPLLHIFAKAFLNVDLTNTSNCVGARNFLVALTPKQIAQLSWNEFPKGMALFFAFFSATLDDHAASLRQLAGELSAEECHAVLCLMSHLKVSRKKRRELETGKGTAIDSEYASLHSFVKCLNDPFQEPSPLLKGIENLILRP